MDWTRAVLKGRTAVTNKWRTRASSKGAFFSPSEIEGEDEQWSGSHNWICGTWRSSGEEIGHSVDYIS